MCSSDSLDSIRLLVVLMAVTVVAVMLFATFIGGVFNYPGRRSDISIFWVKFAGEMDLVILNVTNCGAVSETVAFVKVNGVLVDFSPCPATVEAGGYQLLSLAFNWRKNYLYIIELYSPSGKLLCSREVYAP